MGLVMGISDKVVVLCSGANRRRLPETFETIRR